MKLQCQKLRRLLSLFLICTTFLWANTAIAVNEDLDRLKAGAEKDQKNDYSLEIKPDTVLNSEINLEGDYFSGILSKDSAALIGAPYGSKIVGHIAEITKARSLQRAASVNINIDGLMYPNGEFIEAQGELKASADKQGSNKNSFKRVSKKLIKNSAEIGASTLVGAVDSIQITGISTAIATEGISAGVGAGIGLGVGLIGALTKKGKQQGNSGYSLVNFEVLEDFKFIGEPPILTQDLESFDAKSFGLDIEVNEISKRRVKDFGEMLELDLTLANHSGRKIFGGDFVLVSDSHPQPLYSNSFISADVLNSFDIDETRYIKLAFNLINIDRKDDYKLQLLDAISEKVIVSFDINFKDYL